MGSEISQKDKNEMVILNQLRALGISIAKNLGLGSVLVEDRFCYEVRPMLKILYNNDRGLIDSTWAQLQEGDLAKRLISYKLVNDKKIAYMNMDFFGLFLSTLAVEDPAQTFIGLMKKIGVHSRLYLLNLVDLEEEIENGKRK